MVVLQKSCRMSCVKLSVLHHLLTRGDYRMKHCIFLLKNIQHATCHRTCHSNDKVQQILSSSRLRRQIQSFKFWYSEEDNHEGERVSQKRERDDVNDLNKVSSNEEMNLGNVYCHIVAEHSVAHTSPDRRSHPGLFSFSVLYGEHFMRTPFMRMTPLYSAVGYSSYSPLQLKSTVRFYRGQSKPHTSHKSSRRNTDLDEKYGSADEDTDNESGSEAEVTCELPVAGHKTGYNRLSDLNVGKETTELTSREAVQDNDLVRRKPADEMTLPELSRTSFNIVPYVKRSVTLQNLVRLGVDLSKVQKVAGIAEHLIKSDFDRHIVPFLKLLILVGVEANMIGHIFTTNPLLFLENVQDLELRIGYLLHKKFTLREIATIITKSPVTLLMDPLMLDDKLGFLQSVFQLNDHEVREVVMKYPKILPWKKELLADVKFHVKEFMGFTDLDIRQLILKDPRIFMSGQEKLVNQFDYLYNHMMMSHQQILTWPTILRTKHYIIKNRHLFLLYLDRAQYDPCKENYVSMQALVQSTDEEFCQKVAKCQVQDFYNFCKTL